MYNGFKIRLLAISVFLGMCSVAAHAGNYCLSVYRISEASCHSNYEQCVSAGDGSDASNHQCFVDTRTCYAEMYAEYQDCEAHAGQPPPSGEICFYPECNIYSYFVIGRIETNEIPFSDLAAFPSNKPKAVDRFQRNIDDVVKGLGMLQIHLDF